LKEYCIQYIKWDKLDSWDWEILLRKNVRDFDTVSLCDKYNGWSKFNEKQQHSRWCNLLRLRPEFANKCSSVDGWNSLEGDEWAVLLSHQLQFVDKCVEYDGWRKFNGTSWKTLLLKRPRLSDYADRYDAWRLLSIGDWNVLLHKQPQFISKFKKMFRCEQTEEEILNGVKAFYGEDDFDLLAGVFEL
jgi:hypothetical protein